MKHKILAVIAATLLMVSCNQKNKEATTTDQHMMNNDSTMMHNDSTMMLNDSTMMNNDSKMTPMESEIYSCPMHPEVQGNLNDKCSKCGMKLTVPVTQTSEEK